MTDHEHTMAQLTNSLLYAFVFNVFIIVLLMILPWYVILQLQQLVTILLYFGSVLLFQIMREEYF